MAPLDALKVHTESIGSESTHRARVDWTLIVVLDCQAPTAWPESLSLAGIGTLSIGRGPERAMVTDGEHARLDLPDRWISQNHARLVRAGDRWALEDDSSRNGSRVNGARVERRALADGDILECGGTFLMLRRTHGYVASTTPLAERPEALRTLSPALEHELGILRKVARSPIPVLLLGESGTGKEGLAGAIHALSGREGPFVAVNCGAIPATLIESELFGTRRGAFSGAEDRPGHVRAADRGTLFLDEIPELPVSSQAALLRVLQEKEILALGTTRAIPVDLRVVSATNRPVADLVTEEKLRRDLYARLSGYELHLPPLRERREDLGLLIAALIGRHDRSGEPRSLSRAAAWALFAYSWPLNIRELEQSLAAAVAVSRGEIGLEHLPRNVRDAASTQNQSVVDERDRLIALIRKHRGNLSAVARQLATSRSQLYRLLSRHGVSSEELKRPAPPPRLD